MPNPIDLQPYQMLEKNLRILQLNMMKSGPRMEALINDPQSLELDVLLIQEPSITTYRTHINHSAWRLYRPTTQTDAVRFRSLLYVNRRISTSSHRQLPCDHPDVAAIKIWTADSQTLVFPSTYLQYHFSRGTTRQHYQPSRRYKNLSQPQHKMSSARLALLFPVISTDTTQCGATTISLLDSLKTLAT